eukprot:99021_1
MLQYICAIRCTTVTITPIISYQQLTKKCHGKINTNIVKKNLCQSVYSTKRSFAERLSLFCNVAIISSLNFKSFKNFNLLASGCPDLFSNSINVSICFPRVIKSALNAIVFIS